MTGTARRATLTDLEGMVALFRAVEVSAAATPAERAARIWREMLEHDGVVVFVVEAESAIVATCTLITAPNLLRGGRGHAFIENVATHPAHRGEGHGRAVMRAALAEAWARDSHHVMLQSGRTDPRVHAFYEGLGFEPGLRTAYVARRPSGA